MKVYPSSVSRTLVPDNKGLVTVVGQHDKRLADADVNLIQDLQDYKRRQFTATQAPSGCLSYSPFVYNPQVPNTFFIPAFSFLFNGEVLTIGGNLSSDPTVNQVTVPPPSFWNSSSSSDPASIYVVFLEMWYMCLNASTGSGYYVNPSTGVRYYYPLGCVNAAFSNLIANDTYDPFQGISTTLRVQIQWALRVQPVALAYDFGSYQFGLDPVISNGSPIVSQTVFGSGSQNSPIQQSPYVFTNMGSITGDSTLWRSGDGNQNNSLGTLDGYSYATPIALVFQRNTGVFDVVNNPLGCADPAPIIPNSITGTLASRNSGRYDYKLADSLTAGEVIDTRQMVSPKDFPESTLLKEGFVDLITGATRQAIVRGKSPGGITAAVGTELDYFSLVSQSPMPNTDNIGSFDGFCNGFSSDTRVFYTTKCITVDDKAAGTNGLRWAQGDSFTISVNPQSTIIHLSVQSLHNNLDGSKTPIMLLGGQFLITGLNTKQVVVQFLYDLSGTNFDPGLNSLYVTLGVQYNAGQGISLRNVPSTIHGGRLIDSTSGKTLPVFACSDYAAMSTQPGLKADSIIVYNSNYSNLIFGTRLQIEIPGSSGVEAVTASGDTSTTFVFPRANAEGHLSVIYLISCSDKTTGNSYTVISRSLTSTQTTFTVQGAVPTSSTLIANMLCQDTAQLTYNAPVKGVIAVEETVLAGNAPGVSLDTRISIVSSPVRTATSNTFVIAAVDSLIKGIAGDDQTKFIWVLGTGNTYTAVPVSSAVFSNGLVSITVPATVNLTTQPFFLVVSLLPAFAPYSQLLIAGAYVPYQGEGIAGRNYELKSYETEALVTTNGVGAAPVVGLKDVYPYNREIPIITTLPSQVGWGDAGLANDPVSDLIGSNYVTKRFENVEHTLSVPLFTNDFIQPIQHRKTLQLSSPTSRGFSKISPHVGFAIAAPTLKSALSNSLAVTTSDTAIYVNTNTGNDSNDGLLPGTALKTLPAALSVLPPVLRHNVVIYVSGNCSLNTLKSSLEQINFGDGVVRQASWHALGYISFSIQDAGKLSIVGMDAGPAIIDCGGVSYGDGPTSAFFLEDTRVLLQNLQFQNFVDPAVKVLGADVEFVNCNFTNNLSAVSCERGTLVMSEGSIQLEDAASGIVATNSNVVSNAVSLSVAAGVNPGSFYTAERNTSITLQKHSAANETNVGASTVVAYVTTNSSINCDPTFSTGGMAIARLNAVVSRSVTTSPFVGGVDADTSSTVAAVLAS